MRTSSKMGRFQPETLKNHLERLALGQQRYKQQSRSPYSSKHSFHIRQNIPYPLSGPQLEKQANLKFNKEGGKHLSAPLEPNKQPRQKMKEEAQHVDSSMGYIAQIAGMQKNTQKKRKVRASFLRKKEMFEQSYKIGVLTKKGIQYENSRDDGKEKPRGQSAQALQSKKQISETVSVEEMHYQMVLVHQQLKKMANN